MVLPAPQGPGQVNQRREGNLDENHLAIDSNLARINIPHVALLWLGETVYIGHQPTFLARFRARKAHHGGIRNNRSGIVVLVEGGGGIRNYRTHTWVLRP
jgi:hypothetical protein